VHKAVGCGLLRSRDKLQRMGRKRDVSHPAASIAVSISHLLSVLVTCCQYLSFALNISQLLSFVIYSQY